MASHQYDNLDFLSQINFMGYIPGFVATYARGALGIGTVLSDPRCIGLVCIQDRAIPYSWKYCMAGIKFSGGPKLRL